MLETVLEAEVRNPARPRELTSLGAETLREVADRLPAPLLVTASGCSALLYANPECLRFWGCDAASGPALADLQEAMARRAADHKGLAGQWAQRAELPPGPSGTLGFILLTDGRQVRWQSFPLSEPAGAALHLFEYVPETAAVPPGDELFRLTFEKAAVGMSLISSDLRFLRANPSFSRMLGYSERELLEVPIRHLLDDTEETDWEQLFAASGETFHVERRFRHKNGGLVWVYLSISVVRDAELRPVYYVALAEDVSERKRVEEEQERRTRELQHLATTDPLTGLYNHRFMQDFLAHRLSEAKRLGQQVSVLMLDIDRFRDLNEEHGHDAGNRAIQGVAEALRSGLREHDVACRYGGDEFVIILTGAPLPAALATAERVRSQVRALNGSEGSITCSIGVATFPAHASTTASLLKAADVALYEAKRAGKDRIVGYEPTPQESAAEQLELLQSGLQGANVDAVNALVTAIDLRDRYTGAHCQRVGRLSVDLARRLGCSEEEIELLRLGAPLLDVGKIGLTDELLTKTGRLTPDEWHQMRQHPVWGEELIRRTTLPAAIHQLVRSHHERLDGSGYPDGLRDEEIPLLVRIVHVADVASALREDRPHRRAWPRERVREYLQRHAGTKLDARVVDAYCELFGT